MVPARCRVKVALRHTYVVLRIRRLIRHFLATCNALKAQRQSLLSHASLNLPDPVLGINDLEAQAFFIQSITDIKQKRSQLLINQPWTLHLSGVPSYQGGNKETRQDHCHAPLGSSSLYKMYEKLKLGRVTNVKNQPLDFKQLIPKIWRAH